MSFPAVLTGNISPANPVGFLTPIGPRKINTVPLDVVVEESIRHSVIVTRHPIEVSSKSGVSRGTIADNAFVEPTLYTMRGAVSDLPLSWRIFRSDTLTSYANTNKTTRSISAYQLLLQHVREMIPFKLVTPKFGDLENMLFQRFSVDRDQSTTDAIVFFAEMIELQLVVPGGVTSKPGPEDMIGDQAKTQAIGEVDRGEVSPQAVE